MRSDKMISLRMVEPREEVKDNPSKAPYPPFSRSPGSCDGTIFSRYRVREIPSARGKSPQFRPFLAKKVFLDIAGCDHAAKNGTFRHR
jgi:hypothetical protein